MTPHENAPLPERIAILETIVPEIRATVRTFHGEQSHIVAQLNTILVEMSALKTVVTSLVESRSIWRNPLVWTNIGALGLALAVAFGK